jgi:predicted RND superfamily exporter protein
VRQKFISFYGRLIGGHPWWTLFVCLALAAIAASTLPRLEFRTARSALSTSKDVDQARFDEYLREFGPNVIVAVIEGGAEAERQAFVDAFAGRLREQKEGIREVFDRIPIEFFRRRLLGLAPTGELGMVARELRNARAILKGLGEARGIADLNRVLARRVEEGFRGGGRYSPEAAKGLEELRRFIEGERRLIEHPAETAAEIAGLDLLDVVMALGLDPRLAHGGYLTSADGRLYVVQIQPSPWVEGPAKLKALLATVREAAREARRGREAVACGFLGIPVTVVEESETIGRDGPLSLVFAAAGIGVLVLFAFRRKGVVVLVLIGLGIGILWNFGLTYPIFGGINMITAAVPVILLALGIDFGIHVSVAYEAERALGIPKGEAIATALRKVGPGLATGAVTTCLAFYAICFMEYRGFREFGVVAGNGVLVCLAAMVSALPALLVVSDRRPARLGRSTFAPIVEEIAEEPPDVPPPTSRAGRVWRTTCRSVTALPRTTLLLAAVITAFLVVLARGIGFDYRVEDLLPANAESVRMEARLKAYPDLTPEFAVVLRGSLGGLREAQAKAKEIPLVARTQSILDVLPREGLDERPGTFPWMIGAASSVVRAYNANSIRNRLARIDLDPGKLAPPDPGGLAESLERLSDLFGKILDRVGGLRLEGSERMVRALDGIVEALDGAAEFLGKAPEGWKAEFGAAQANLWGWARDRRAEVDRMLSEGPVDERDLPRQILDHFKGAETGRYALYLYPSENLADRQALARFVEAARQVDPPATGYPVVFLVSTDLIHRGFSTAVAAAAVVIFVTLLIDFRRPSLVLLATIPKLVGIAWMLGIMRVFGIDYNLANQIVIPLIIGVGLAYGIHIIHRFIQEKPGDRDITRVLQHTGGAIFLSGLTTMIGFGSLALATHRGLASMGTVLLFGVGSALLASIYILPNLLLLIYRPRR